MIHIKIHHVGFLAKNIKSTLEAFQNMGAGQVIIEKSVTWDAIRKIYIAFILFGGYRIEIIEPDKESEYYPLLKRFKNSPYHFCYEVKDLEKETKKLQEEGYHVMENPLEAPCIENRRVAFLMGAHTGIIELLEGGI